MSVTPSALDRMWQYFRTLVRAELPELRFLGTYEYTILATDGSTVDGAPVDTSLGLPSLRQVELRADSIARQTPKLGDVCHVVFLNGDRTKPKCSWTAPDPTAVRIGPTASDFVALSSLVATALGGIQTAYNTHTHNAIGLGAPTGPPLIPLGTAPSTAANLVKAQ